MSLNRTFQFRPNSFYVENKTEKKTTVQLWNVRGFESKETNTDEDQEEQHPKTPEEEEES